jgi:hypothetical protein
VAALGTVLRPGPEGQVVTSGGARWPVVERCGHRFVWFDPAGGPPRFTPSAPPSEGWTGYLGHDFPLFASHPQETTENAVDVAHFALLHGYRDVRVLEPPVMAGPVLTVAYAFRRGGLPLRIRIRVEGLGFSRVESRVEPLGIDLSLLVLPTPVDEARLRLRIAVAARRPSPGPIGRALARLLRRLVLFGYIREVAADIPVWNAKRYLPRPLVVPGDGPLAQYRRWCLQFGGGAEG